MNGLLSGIWIFASVIYQDRQLPRPNPDLMMTFDFRDASNDTLKYYRKNETGFCERNASYNFDGKFLTQTVTAVNPNNADFCSTDPDMNLGLTTRVPVEIKDGKIYMTFQLGEENLIYIWERFGP